MGKTSKALHATAGFESKVIQIVVIPTTLPPTDDNVPAALVLTSVLRQ